MTERKQIEAWHILSKNPNDLPEPGERVLMCVAHVYVGEGWLCQDGKWQRYCDLDPVEKFMNAPVTAWRPMPKPPKEEKQRKEGQEH